ncbi:MAG: serine/threonine protein kinase [Myxococcaceae bacterium]|nr:serine/threonine protein kinase [Myxococcaceae bacterium]
MQSHPQPGTLLAGRYRLIRVIGEGGMGIVWEAENIGTERRVAVKWLHASLASNPEAAKRLIREATATCRIRHPNVVDVYDVIKEGDSVALVMELLEGEPLESVLRRGGIPLHQLVSLLLPAMRGVAEAHRLGIVHRDIHPANIFLATQPHDSRPVAKVLDFGISKLGSTEGPSLTQSGTTLGTPLYMSYEQLCSARDVDLRTDVYSFGVVLYEGLTGRPPFDAESFAELAVKIATAEPVPPKQLRPDIPTALERIILWAMARNREDRIPNLEALARELEPFASENAFRGQMTDAERVLPSVVPRSDRPPAHESPSAPPPASMPPSPPVSKVDTAGKLRTPLARSMLAVGGARGAKSRAVGWAVAAVVACVLAAAIALLMRRSGPAADLASVAPAPTVTQPLPGSRLPPAAPVAPVQASAAAASSPLAPPPMGVLPPGLPDGPEAAGSGSVASRADALHVPPAPPRAQDAKASDSEQPVQPKIIGGKKPAQPWFRPGHMHPDQF